jgi:hypothetical protein
MWIFTNDAFFSIVKNRGLVKGVVVRARLPEDLTKTFGTQHEVIESDDSDYRFRMFLDHDYVSKVISKQVKNIDYDNLKNSIDRKDVDRRHYYSQVWGVMLNWQKKLYPLNKKKQMTDDYPSIKREDYTGQGKWGDGPTAENLELFKSMVESGKLKIKF